MRSSLSLESPPISLNRYVNASSVALTDFAVWFKSALLRRIASAQ